MPFPQVVRKEAPGWGCCCKGRGHTLLAQSLPLLANSCSAAQDLDPKHLGWAGKTPPTARDAET